MIHNKKGIIPLVFIMGGVIMLIIVAVIVFASSSTTIPGQVKKTVECDITVEGTLSGPKIRSFTCSAKLGCGFLDSLRLRGSPKLSLFKEEGTIKLVDRIGVVDKQSYNIIKVFGKEVHTLKGCTLDNKLNLRLTDENDQLLDSKVVII